MKNAKNAENLKSFVKKVLKEGKKAEETATPQMDPLRAIVRGVLSYDVGDAKADDALAVIDREFCDLNEVRVATELELQDMLGAKYPEIDRRAMKMVAILNAVFEKEGTLSFERVKTMGKKEIRQFVRDLPEMTPYVEAYAMLFGFDAPAMPVDREMIELLVESDAVDEEAKPEDVQRGLENAMKAEEYADFYHGVRRLAAARRKK